MHKKHSHTVAIVASALVIIGLVGASIAISYNSLVTANLAVDTQWAQVENQLQRQFELIPNIEATVKGAAKNEQGILMSIADARKSYASSSTVDDKVMAANAFQAGLNRFSLTMEAYPVIQSTQAFRDLMVTLEGSQNRVSTERARYNEIVGEYNGHIVRFPQNIVAKLFGFHARQMYHMEAEARKAPRIDFSR
jgi:LemA protein